MVKALFDTNILIDYLNAVSGTVRASAISWASTTKLLKELSSSRAVTVSDYQTR
jgi:hypothetical protein